jgi:hypothetical protein
MAGKNKKRYNITYDDIIPAYKSNDLEMEEPTNDPVQNEPSSLPQTPDTQITNQSISSNTAPS